MTIGNLYHWPCGCIEGFHSSYHFYPCAVHRRTPTEWMVIRTRLVWGLTALLIGIVLGVCLGLFV